MKTKQADSTATTNEGSRRRTKAVARPKKETVSNGAGISPVQAEATLSPDVQPDHEAESGPQDANGGSNGTGRQIVYLKVSQVEPNPFQPRSQFKRSDMTKLVESVREHGVLQPITVRTKASTANGANGHYKDGSAENGDSTPGDAATIPAFQLVAGERRLRASKTAGKETIPAIIRDDLTDEQAAELAIVENLQRSDLNVMEEAAGYARLMKEFSLKEERIAQRVGRSTQAVKNTLKLLQLPEPV
jgi:ParB family chromosome partitioning protein